MWFVERGEREKRRERGEGWRTGRRVVFWFWFAFSVMRGDGDAEWLRREEEKTVIVIVIVGDGCEWIRTVCSREEREGEVCTGRFVLVFMTAETDRHGMWNATRLDSYSKYSKYSKVNNSIAECKLATEYIHSSTNPPNSSNSPTQPS